jgi:two-component system, NtrC family, sensor kinase
MMFAFHRLPTILLLGALVPIFWFLRRSNRSYQVRLWVIAWSLVLIRVIVQVFGSAVGLSGTAINAIDLGGLQLSGVVLAVSMTRIFHDPRQRWPFFLMAAVPSVMYAELFAFGYQRLWVFALLGIVLGTGVCAWILLYYRRHVEKYMVGISGILLLGAFWGAWRTLHGRIDLGFYTIETATYALAGFLYWYSYKRLSPGVVLASAGFFAWAAVFPVFYLVVPTHPKAVEGLIALANVPKFWVAIGMIVTLLEDKSRSAELAEAQERATREQIQGFFQVTSRLLSGADVASFCDEIAKVVTQSSNFARVTILLTDDQRNLYPAGAAGMDEKDIARARGEVEQLTVARVEELCEFALRVGTHSFRLTSEQLRGTGTLSSPSQHPRSDGWQKDDKMLVPLSSTRGSLLGCLLLDEPRDAHRVSAQDLTAVEMLSTDLAIAIENSHLQRQLVVSEKLAGLGKLIAGTGHELNNPLTAVLGYAEMLSGSTDDQGTRRSAEVIRREALRMKQIIENLLSFARQTKFERRPVSLTHVLQEVLKLRSYEIRHRGVQVAVEISPALPGVLVDEGMLKQVFLNVINNSIEALRDIPGGRISIEATQQGERMQLRFSDNGPGFSNPDRVFDPFFTTKDPGKGPGLGLSVSYGIVKQHGGEISAYNLHPSGACILIELPIAGSPASILEPSGVAEA